MEDERRLYEDYKQSHHKFLIKLKQAIKLSGLTSAEICRQTGISKEHFSRVMNQKPEDCYTSFYSIALIAICTVIGFDLALSVNAKGAKAPQT